MTLRPWRRAAPDGLIAAVLLSFLATAGLFYVNIMAALVDGLESGLRFTARDAGFVAAANVYGAAVGAFSAVFAVKTAPWRKVALGALLGMIAIDLLSTQLRTPPLLIGARFCHGLIGGFLVGTAYAIFARVKAPDRVFGMLLVVQFGLGGLGLVFLPRLVPIYGAPVLFLALAAFSLVTLCMLPFLDAYERPRHSEGEDGGNIVWAPLAAALVAVFLFQAANMGVAAYVIGLGRTFGLQTREISATLGIANWLGALGAVLVVALGVRFGRTRPILIGMGILISGTLLFLATRVPWLYAVANIVTGMAWSFTIAYLLGLCAAFDRSGRSAAIAGFSSKMGLASGPALGGMLLEETHFPRLVMLSVLGLGLALMDSIWPAAKLDRAAAD
jgi:DHA1 family inner membrane transport protein